MPTASEFEAAAHAIDGCAVRLASLLDATEAALGPDVLRGGTLTTAVELAVDRSRRSVHGVVGNLATLADESRRRAAACRQAWAAATAHEAAQRLFAGELAAWRDGGSIGPPPSPPRPPDAAPPWVEL